MTRETIFKTMQEYLSDMLEMDPAEIREDSVFFDDLEVSSVEIFMTAGKIQQYFKVSLTERMLSKIVTFGDLVDCVAGLI